MSMNLSRWIRAPFAITGIATLSGCPFQPGPTANTQPAVVPSWSSITEKTCCEALDPNYCLGLQGFSVSVDGAYGISDSPSSGRLQADELKQLNQAIGELLYEESQPVATDFISCIFIPVCSSDSISIQSPEAGVTSFFTIGDQAVCTGSRDPSAYNQVHETLHGLMAKYYFPSLTPPSDKLAGYNEKGQFTIADGLAPGSACPDLGTSFTDSCLNAGFSILNTSDCSLLCTGLATH